MTVKEKNKMKTKIFKIGKWVVVGLLGLWVIIMLIGYFFPNGAEQIRAWQQKKILAQYEKALADLEEQKKVDNIGGKTPEETLGMLMKTVGDNDYKDALLYYEQSVNKKIELLFINKSEEEKKDFMQHLSIILGAVSTGKIVKKVYLSNSNTYCSLLVNTVSESDRILSLEGTDQKIYVKKGDKVDYEANLVLNKYTNVWKVLLPY
jgi:hypothetical protein